jgi:hypothetical protein
VGLRGTYQAWQQQQQQQQQQQHTACTVTASGARQDEARSVSGLLDSHPGYIC